jgi:glycosyltransferase involved in cell wall biosynthesis
MSLTLGSVAPLFPRSTRLVIRQANDVSADFAALIRRSLFKHRVARLLALTFLRRADAVVCQSEAMKRDLVELLGEPRNLHVIGNPIDLHRVARLTDGVLPRLRGAPALVSVGRLVPQKGFDVLLPAVASLRTRYPDVHLTILGDGPERPELEALARRLELEHHVTFGGFVPEPIPFVRAADVFVLASRYEGFPNAALEALACGTPVVLTNCPGANAEIVRPAENGRLAETVEPAAVARALELALAERGDYDRARITADCAARFDVRNIVARYERMFCSVAES